jgi:UDP-N-acetylglucosamine:LPS N-acetylglucosamine transferase
MEKRFRNHRLKVCLAFSAGGHFTEIKQVMPALENCAICYATPLSIRTKSLENAYYLADTDKHNLIEVIIRDLAISFLIIVREKPDVVLTTGAFIVIPLCILAKFAGRKVIYIETLARITSPSFTGRILYHFSDLFLVQWKELLNSYGSKARYCGRVF